MENTMYLMLILLVGSGRMATGQELVEPIKPQMADHYHAIFRLDIDTGSFRELALYNNLRFEIDPHGRKFDPKDADETWKVAYRARPVFEEEDYPKALKTFESGEAEYRRLLEKKRRDQQKVYEHLYHYYPPERDYVLVPINASYLDSTGHPMELANVDVLFKGFEVLGFLEAKQIQVAANGDDMIFGIWQRKLYVLPFEKYHQLHIGPSTRSQTFTMQYVDSVYQDLRYYDLRNLIEKDRQQHR